VTLKNKIKELIRSFHIEKIMMKHCNLNSQWLVNATTI